MSLPSFNTKIQELSLMQSAWASTLDPIVNLPTSNWIILKEIALVTGTNEVNHKLGRKLQGWYIVRQRSAARVYDTQDANNTPNLTLSLTSDANVTVDLFVF